MALMITPWATGALAGEWGMVRTYDGARRRRLPGPPAAPPGDRTGRACCVLHSGRAAWYCGTGNTRQRDRLPLRNATLDNGF